MLKSLLLALLLGDQGLLDAHVEQLQSLVTSKVTPEAETEALQILRVLESLDRLSKLAGKLGGKLAAESDDFEEGLAALLDDDAFAEMVGELVQLSMEVMEDPHLPGRLDAVLPSQVSTSLASARFLDEIEPLSRWAGASLPDEFRDDVFEFHRPDAKEVGRGFLDVLYDPAATPFTANVLWCLIRGIGRAMVLRHFDAHGIEPSPDYLDSLFEGFRSDIDQLDKAMEVIYDQAPGAMIRRELLIFDVRRNRVAIDEAMEQLDANNKAWVERLGSSPE